MATSRYMQLLQERADLVSEGTAVLDAAEAAGRGLTAEEVTAADVREQKLAAVNAEIAVIERQREREREIGAAAQVTGVAPAYVTPRAAGKPWGTDTGAPFGEFLQAVFRARTQGNLDPRLIQAAGQGANETVGSDGGFLVQKDFVDEIMLALTGGEILKRVRRIPLSGNSNGIKINVVDEASRATGSRFGGVQGYWVDEGTAPTGSRPKFFKLGLELKKLAALGYATDELLADASALEAVMTQAFAEELKFLVEDSIINGGGAGGPLGILNAASLVTVSKETGQPAATVLSTNLSKMWSRLHPRSRGNAVWLINSDVEPQLDELSIPAGTAALEPRIVSYGSDNSLRIKGAPVIPVEYCATLGTVGDVLLVDLSQYAFIDKGGVQQASSMHVAFATDEMAFRAIYRVDGQPMWRTALTPFKGSNTQSPFVALQTRS